MKMFNFDDQSRKKNYQSVWNSGDISDKRLFLEQQARHQQNKERLERIVRAFLLPLVMLPTALEIAGNWRGVSAAAKKRLATGFFVYPLLIFFLASCFFPATNFQTLIIAIIYGISWAVKKYQEEELAWIKMCLAIGLQDGLGNVPKRLEHTENELLLASPGIPLEVYIKKKPNLESGLNCRIKRILPGNSFDQVKLELAHGFLPTKIEFDEKCMEACRQNKESFLMGFDGDNYILVPLQEIPHFLCCGSSGQGKSVLLRAGILSILLSAGDLAILFGIDFKGTLEFQYWESQSSAPIAGTVEAAGAIIDFACELLEKRFKRYRDAYAKDIKSYREKVAPNEPQIFIFVDEWADMDLQLTAWDKKNRSPITYREKLESLTRLGRAVGIHCYIATQYAESSIMPTQIKNNLSFRALLKVQSDQASINLCGSDDCYNLPEGVPGRLIFSTGGSSNQQLQGVYVSEDKAVEILNTLQKRRVSQGYLEFLKRTGRTNLVAEMLAENTRRGF